MSVRDFAHQAFAAPAAASEPDHVGAGAGLVDEDEAVRIKLLLTVSPVSACDRDVGTILFAGVNAFF
jgi:hypothetical protein